MSNIDDSTDHLHTDPISKRTSFYAMNHGAAGTRNSLYETTTSLEYNPRPASSHNYLGNSSTPKLPNGHAYAQLVEGRQSYGDVRKSANVVPSQSQRNGSIPSAPPTGMYDEFENAGPAPYGSQQTSWMTGGARDRSKGRASANVHARATSNEVVYDRY